MTFFIHNKGDESVGIFPHSVAIDMGNIILNEDDIVEFGDILVQDFSEFFGEDYDWETDED